MISGTHVLALDPTAIQKVPKQGFSADRPDDGGPWESALGSQRQGVPHIRVLHTVSLWRAAADSAAYQMVRLSRV